MGNLQKTLVLVFAISLFGAIGCATQEKFVAGDFEQARQEQMQQEEETKTVEEYQQEREDLFYDYYEVD